ncbi:TPA: helix-turn-helix domain-containing protein [Citrobacter freundii]|uniref:AraC family transcriptional regulator n=1 Tax=Enterobacterales TaxID=91347 RepID=UPI0010C555DE|nr:MULTISPECIES: AraC family transcriptional regulator [Enterobacterales]EGT0669073.1 AraC family transcriptional regulator [Citrobacter werkmanii]NRF75342.1 AraC family transcriptional regulator [Citrobacter braakii]UBH63292.1 AraC family transcriptional regulator [Proteus vulgaris]WFW62692.1 AraC family transcriptional regulator [Citrobacter freundii]VTP70079.1 putative transcriptional regulator [Proteus vulgaris]
MIKINNKHWISTSSPLENKKINTGLLFSTDTTDFSKKTEFHSHSWIQFIYTRTGTVYVEVDEKFWHLPPLHGVWLPKDSSHALWSSEKAEYICININKDFDGALNNVVSKLVEITPIIDSYSAYFLSHSHELIKAQELKECAFIHFLIELNEVSFTLPYPVSPELIALCREIQAESGLSHTPEQCAEKLSISMSTFVRRFKKETGMTYQEWRLRMRLLQSITRVRKNESIFNIALDTGYSSASAYIYAFKKVFGVSPTRYNIDNQ